MRNEEYLMNIKQKKDATCDVFIKFSTLSFQFSV